MADPTATVESELKFAVPATFQLPPLACPDAHDNRDPGAIVTAESGGRRSLRARYHDTVDLRLARSGLTLRYRTGEGRPTWTLKLPVEGAEPGERLELSLHGSPTVVPEQLRRLVTGQVRSAALVEVARLTTRRDVWVLRNSAGEQVAEFVDDLVSVISAGAVVARFRELELERHGIAATCLASLVARLTAAGASAGEFQPKLVRALGPRATAHPDVPPATRVGRDDPAAALVTETIRSGVRRLLAQDIRVRQDQPDAIHQMRVACRRLRSDLQTFAPLLEPATTGGPRAELGWLAGELADARDTEVLRARLAKTFRSDPLCPLDSTTFARLDVMLGSRQEQAHARAAAALDDPRYVALLESVVLLARVPETTAAAQSAVRIVLPRLVAPLVVLLDAKVGRLGPNVPDRRWHTARLHAKRARYAVEAAAAALGKTAADTATALAAVQDVLGAHQDAAIAADRLLTIAAGRLDDGPLVLLCGRLAERERTAVRSLRTAFPVQWKVASRARLRRWLPETHPPAAG